MRLRLAAPALKTEGPGLRAAIPPHLVSHATIAVRPAGMGPFHTVFPDA
ncbi:MAG: hypothetical protein FWD11_08230 [Micrococcales bacterium]|nr:hypothetical protein [Micrococcales bacterium]